MDYEETEIQLKRNLQRRLASRDLEVNTFDVAVDEVTAGPEHFGVALAALIMPNSLMMGRASTGRVRSTGRAGIKPADVQYKAPAAKAMRPGERRSGDSDFSL